MRPWWPIELVSTKWVGTARGTYGPFLHPPPVATVRATFTAHGDRLPGQLPAFPAADIGCIPSLPMRQGRTLRHLARGGPSPCTRLSRAPTTMATLTAERGLRGVQMCCHTMTSALLPIPAPLSHVPIHGLKRSRVGGGYRTTSPRIARLPSGRGIYQVDPRRPFAAPCLSAASEDCVTHDPTQSHSLSQQARS